MYKLLSFRNLFVVVTAIALLCPALAVVAQGGQAPGGISWKSAGFSSAVSENNEMDVAVVPAAEQKRHLVVQFDQIPAASARKQLAGEDIELLRYLGSNAYFVKVIGTDEAALAQKAGVAAAFAIETDWKLHPMLLRGAFPVYARFWLSPGATVPTEGPGKAAEGVETLALYIIFHPDVDLGEGCSLVEQHGGMIRDLIESINGAVIWLPRSRLNALAGEDAVQWLEPPLPPLEGTNNSNRIITQADDAQATPYNLDGTGINVLVYDGGTADETHDDLFPRLHVRDSSGLSSHATHVSGTIGGDGSLSASQGGTPYQWRGMAPNVTIESYGFDYDGTGYFLYTNPGDIEADYNQAINTYECVIANNSIGTNTAANGFPCEFEGDYGATAMLIDAIVGGSLGSPMRIVWANGNERGDGRCGTGYLTTAPPACAKNHITVGALNSNDDSMTWFSSWGPTDDGRLKPDVSAPGCQSAGDDTGVTSTVPVDTYGTMCGTSMASPTVCGISALILQDFKAQYVGVPLPRNSTLKVLLAHNAVDLGNTGPDYQYGYGSVRATDTIDFMRNGSFKEDSLDQAEQRVIVLNIPPGALSLKATLAWDDPPGAVNTIPELVNDLDLEAVSPSGVIHYPWTLDPANGGIPAIRTLPDHVNNIEQVVVDSPEAGAWIVRVKGYAVPAGPQVFSLATTPDMNPCLSAGALAMDAEVYNRTGTVEATVVDCDINTNPGVAETVTINISSTTEPAGESVLLTETSVDSSIFVGAIALDVTNSAGVLQISHGDTITAVYNDADDGSGNPAVVTDNALVDCVDPVVFNVQIIDITSMSAVVTFDTDEPATVQVLCGESCGGPYPIIGQSMIPDTQHSIMLTGLSGETDYYCVIEATDASQNQTIDDNGGMCYSFTTTEQRDYFTEIFESSDNDLDNLTLTLTPDGLGSFYDACTQSAAGFPTDPTGGAVLSLSDDDSTQVFLSGELVWLYGNSYNNFFVGSNGYITFGAGDTTYSESLDVHFNTPRISGLFDDLEPPAGGTISWKQLADRAVVTYENVPEYGTTNSNNFQIEMFFDGMIRITWLNLDAADGLSGISQGGGVPADFLESNLSAYLCGEIPEGVLVFFIECGGGLDNVTPALANLGITDVTVVHNDADFAGQLTTGNWDLVIVDNYASAIADTTLDELVNYYDGGGRIIFAYWDLLGQSAHPFIDRAGVTLSGAYSIPEPINSWIQTPLFDTPNPVPDMTLFSDGCNIDGQYMEPTTATAHAGYTATPTTNQAGLTVNTDGRLILNGFMPQVFDQDEDTDGKIDMVELYENEICFMLGCGCEHPPVPAAPDPADDATNVPVDTLLTWNNSGQCWYEENFDDDLAQDWQEDVDADWQVVSGEYRAYQPSPVETNSLVATYGGQVFADCRYEVKTRTGEADAFAQYMLIRATADFETNPVFAGSAYFFGIHVDAYSIWKQVDGVMTNLVGWTYSEHLNGPTEWNTLAVNAVGSALEFYINGQPVWSGSDPDLTSGRIGLLGFADIGFTRHYYFDDVLVCPPTPLGAAVSAEQRWYNQHPLEGGTPFAAPADKQVPAYPGEKTGGIKNPTTYKSVSGASSIISLPELSGIINDVGPINLYYYTVEPAGGGYDYYFKLRVDDPIPPGSELDWIVFFDNMSASSEIQNPVLVGPAPPPFTGLTGSGGYHNGPTFLNYPDPGWMPVNVGDKIEWQIYADNLIEPILWSNLTGSPEASFREAIVIGDECPTTYDVYLGTDPGAMVPVCDDLTEPVCDPPGDMESGVTYYWQVIAENCCGQTVGPIWSFTTEDDCPVPPEPVDPDPTDGAADVPCDTLLTWNDGGGPGGCVVVPNANEAVEGDSNNAWPFNIGGYKPSQRYQQICAAAEVGQAGTITEIRFRPDTYGDAFGPTDMTVDIYLGYAATTVLTPSETFANNIGSSYTLVYSGTLTLSSADTGTPTRDFDIVVDVDDVFNYDPSMGPLLLDIFMHTNPVTTQFDAAGLNTYQGATARIYSITNVSDTTGIVNYGGPDSDPYGLVTMFCFDGATPLTGVDTGKTVVSVKTPVEYEIDQITGAMRTAGLTIKLPGVVGGAISTSDSFLPAGWIAPNRKATNYTVEPGYKALTGPADVLLLASDDDPTILRTGLAAFPDINSVDYFDARVVAPTLPDLVPYDVVIAMSNDSWADSVATGDVLADYVDGGGKVIDAVGCFDTGGGWELAGRFVTGGYEPFVHGTTEFFAHSLGSFDPTHPIMDGVTTLTDELVVAVGLQPAAQWVADWDNGVPLVATMADNVVGINIFAFDFGYFTGDVPLLYHNAIFWLLGTTEPCPTTWDVYLGTDPGAMSLVCEDLTEPVCDPGLLEGGVTYYWQVIAENCCGQTEGPIWSFTTATCPEIVGWETATVQGDELYCDIDEGFVEPRICGITKLRICFNQLMDTSVVDPGVILVDGVSNDPPPPNWFIYWQDDYCLIIEFDSALPNEDTYVITISDDVKSADGCPLAGDRNICIIALAGDTNSNRSVNAQDMLAVRSHIGQIVDCTNARYDVNGNGVINAQDMLAIRARIGHSAPPCPCQDHNILLIEDQSGFEGADDVLIGDGHSVTVINNERANGRINLLDTTFLNTFDLVIWGARGDGFGEVTPTDVADSLENYIQGGGNLLVTGYDTLGSPTDTVLANLVRAINPGDQVSVNPDWQTTDVDIFVLNGLIGDYRNQSFSHIGYDDDILIPDTGQGAVILANTPGASAKIIFTDLPAPGGTVGYWNGGLYGTTTNAQPDFSSDGIPQQIFRNWAYGSVYGFSASAVLINSTGTIQTTTNPLIGDRIMEKLMRGEGPIE